MADDPQPRNESETGDDAEHPKRSLTIRFAQIREWTTGSPLRSTIVGGGFLFLVLATVSTWLYLASLTVSQNVPTLEDALEAYDQNDLEEARLLVARIMERGQLTVEEHGGPLFVLGAVKTAEAETQWSSQHRQSHYLIAAKYLREAYVLGFPPGREQEGAYLLGLSLIESGENDAGLKALEEALLLNPGDATDLHLTLAKAYLQADPAQLDAALVHVDTALADPELDEKNRASVMVDRIVILLDLGRLAEARQSLQALPSDGASRMSAVLASGRVELTEIRRQLQSVKGDPAATDQLRHQIAAVVERLQAIPISDDAGEEASYLVGEAYALAGDTTAAIRQFERARKQFSSSPIGIAASIAEGDLYRTKKQDYPHALAAYRRALTALDEPRAYRNRLLPLSELKQRILAAHADFVVRDEFEAAIGLIEQGAPLFGRTRQLEVRAATLSDWASQLLADVGQGNSEALRREGRLRHREAGVDYEELARRQFTTPQYLDAVWLAAENFFLGQSYASAIRMLDEYLRNESVKRNAIALLRLGQSHLAKGQADKGIEALEECIELHPHDAALYRARLDCARAYRDRDDFHGAEQLLLANLNGSGQTPKSPEWRDSLFELGHLLHDAGRYDEAIDRLDDLVRRDELDPRSNRADQTQLAMYLIGESNRHAAEEPLAQLEMAKTVNERESAALKAQQHLTEALRSYEKVWVSITSSEEEDEHDRAMLRNCYMLKGAVLFDLGRVENSPQRFKEAIDAYSNVSTLYQHEPFVLETFVQIANCQRRLGQPMKAQMNIDRALQLLDQMPEDADFLAATNFDRGEWKLMLTQMLEW